MSLDVPPKLAALFQAIHNPEQPDRPFTDEITDDLEAEGETLVDDIEPMADVFDVSKLKEFLLDASKGVTNETEKEYKRLMRRCQEFLKSKRLIKADDEFFTTKPGPLVPLHICAWIMDE
ncbi:hypothetical protein B0H14DRAFT_2368119 [Mycena olivaceomarginata]|nr:hypothetical protein B0H14DRAFT_2368119 [Mycena olivaceomarginata]